MTTTNYTLSIDHSSLHTACAAVDRARRGTSRGSNGVSDAFGGSYYASSYESLPGVIRQIAAVRQIRSDAWVAVHGAAGQLTAARAALTERPVRAHREARHKFAARVAEYQRGADRVDAAIATARAAVATAIACHHAMAALAATGLLTYHPELEICGIYTDMSGVERLAVSGLEWLAGLPRLRSGHPSLADALTLVEHGLPALEAAMWMPGFAA